jgi:DhnA family fructose-bisphosphate aldolase class Ia
MKLGRLFPNDGRLLIIPHEAIRVQARWVDVTKAVIRGGADALILTPGILKTHHSKIAGKIPIIMNVPLEPEYIDMAVKMDVAAVKVHHFGPEDTFPWDQVQKFSMKCEEKGMPFLYEPVPMTAFWSEGGNYVHDPDIIMKAVLNAVARGADFIKTSYTGDPESFKKITSRCPIPIVALGGPLVPDRETLEWIKGTMEGGGVGGAFGRTTTTHKSPEKIVRAIHRIIHDDATVDEALKELQ